MKEAGQLNQHQAYWLSENKPAEELYDLQSDPYELNNLAGLEEYDGKKSELNNHLMEWMTEIDDLYELEELDQAELAWPGGIQPTTNGVDHKVEDNKLVLSCSTLGASIAYRSADKRRWEVYSEPIPLPKNIIETKAIRYGYLESEVKTISL